ncbi:MAG: UDP-glucose 4-epimerase GalE [Pseudomonadota bacterium]|nr:UDP-glucose 4-epimerase GalE [Pseudomonadota bacterium]
MKVLVTGGTGYIGSHTCVELLRAGHEVVILDNLANSKVSVLARIEAVAGRRPVFFHGDCRDRGVLETVFKAHPGDAVIHFAGLKAVGESVARPLLYYENNLGSTLALCEVMADHGVKRIVFSSSATVYGDPATTPIREDFPLGPTNPYGQTKMMIERILQDLKTSDPSWQVILLRYFNPVGAHESGSMGEDPAGIPNNLMPYISQVAVGKLDRLRVFGNDYPTPDGTGIRDYIHVVDLAQGHLKALERLAEGGDFGVYNLGTGRGYSVLEVIRAFEKAAGRAIPYEIVGRRSGDIASCYADPALAERELNWRARRGIEEMCADAWRWQSRHPRGYP